ncbi:uncharacterized protein N7518_005923 [Penicillium psychrosexuale]|uniref:uncharacterized protein n=1 Tax=Penicillium psychrosexuale TaxID=1002107 RepID=UPI0025456F58|nr:uncharacterized protein N7518_005923 [Penicillium psychrosexuale]KAJ5788912.1 hypothetical protein N7518_005923 [Penicillium psychrosexuale]
MAQLNNDSKQNIDCTEILSPQPFTPPSKGFLISSLESTNVPVPSLADNAQMSSTQDHEYNSSSSSRHSTSDVFGREMDDELDQLKSRASSRSSLASTPASVLIHPVDRMNKMPEMDINEKIAGYRMEESEFGDFNDNPANNRTIRQREAAFRKPSSVRAMQMHTEDEADDDDYITPPRRRQGLRSRSPGPSPLRRSPYYSPNAPKQPKPKREAPLVLLHCTLLPPSIPVPGASDPRNQDILEEELPAQYWRRWRRLQDRVGSSVLRDRGVLISHPEDLYDILEERLLESLELKRPRLQNGHFVGQDDNDSSSGSDGEFSDIGESETDGEQGDECPDCGKHVQHGDSNRKWEIQVFAANGLMRAGAWAAAWRDMEKVDVEVGLWLPSDIRDNLERRLAEKQMAVVEQANSQIPQMSPSVDGRQQVPPEFLQSPRQGHARMVSDTGSFTTSDDMTFRQAFPEAGARLDHTPELGLEKKEHEPALSTLLINYIRVLAADKRNLALLLLSVLVVFLAIGSRQQQVHVYSHFSQGSAHEILPSSAVPNLSVAPSLIPSVSIPNSDFSTSDLVESASLIVDSLDSHAQAQVEEDENPSSLSDVPVEFSVPFELMEPTRTTQLPLGGDPETPLDDTVDSTAMPLESSPSSTDPIESPVLLDETAQSDNHGEEEEHEKDEKTD